METITEINGVTEDATNSRFEDFSSGLIRSSIKSCLDNRIGVTTSIALLVLLVLSHALWYNQPFLSAILAVVVGVIIGIFLASEDFGLMLRRVKVILDRDWVLPTQPAGGDPAMVGIDVVDDLIEVHRKKLHEIADAVRGMQDDATAFMERYRLLTDNLAAAVMIRSKEGKILYCSPYTEVLTGYSLAEVNASPIDFFSSIVHPSDRENYQRALKISELGEAFQFRYRFYHKSGIEMWAETRTVPLLNGNGETSSSLSITLDVTGSVRYQKQVEQQNKELQDFTYMVSHDLKAPIFTIKGMANILHEDFAKKMGTDFSDTLGHITQAAGKLEQLVSSVLEYSKISLLDTTSESIELSSVMEEVLRDFKPQIDKAQARITCDKSLPIVLGDRLQLYRVFSNLVGNALKYASPERKPEIVIGSEPAQQTRYSTILVRDNGLGIPNDKLSAIWRPFQRVHGKNIEGSGIGLACVKKLMEKLGGEVEVKSEEGKGCTFFVTLRKDK